MKHAGELKSHASWSIIGQNFQSGQTVSSLLKLMTQSSYEAKPLDHSICYKPDLSLDMAKRVGRAGFGLGQSGYESKTSHFKRVKNRFGSIR